MPSHDPLPKHQTVAIFGLAASGIAAAHLLASFNKTIIASDTAPESRRAEFLAKLPPGVRLVLGHNEIGAATIIVTSPGLLPMTPILLEAAERKIPVIAELELGVRATSLPIVAITGTDGKTTTTTLISHILAQCGVRNQMGGNVGIPLSHVVQNTDRLDVVVVETSAFQLIFCPTLQPHVLVATNIAEDHTEYFQNDKQKYIEAKRRPLRTMRANDIAILNASDPEICKWASLTLARRIWYGESKKDIPNHALDFAYLDGAEIVVYYEGVLNRFSIDTKRMPGQHNALNAMSSVLACLSLGCKFDDIVSAFSSYKLPPHRLQHIKTVDDIRFIDDSKATNPHAAIAALKTIDESLILIAGGVDKGLSLTEWIEAMKVNVRSLLVIGAITDRLVREAIWAAIPCPIHRCSSLDEAVVLAHCLAQKNDCRCVLLSPGCSSYDMFLNYEERGEAFAHAVVKKLMK